MSRDEYLDKLMGMTAQELDTETAEKVMGWLLGIKVFRKWNPSTFIANAWEIFIGFAYPSIWRDGAIWVCKLRLTVDSDPVFAYCDSAPRAICIAACLAVWENDDNKPDCQRQAALAAMEKP